MSYITNSREISDIKATLIEVAKVMNAKRFINGADNRMYGIQPCRMETTHFIVFTAKPKINTIEEFKKQKPAKDNFYEEVFRFDQKVHIINFLES